MSESSESREHAFTVKSRARVRFSPKYGDKSRACAAVGVRFHGVVVCGEDGLDYLKVYGKDIFNFGKINSEGRYEKVTFGYIPIIATDGTVLMEKKIEDEQVLLWMENDILRIEKEIAEATQDEQLKRPKIEQFLAGLTPEQQVLVQGARNLTRATFRDLARWSFVWSDWEQLPSSHTDNFLKLLELFAAPEPCAALPGMEEALADGKLSVRLNKGTYYHDGLYRYFDSEAVETNYDCWQDIDEVRVGSYSVDLQADSVLINWCRIFHGPLPRYAGAMYDFETTIVPLADFR